MPVPWGNTRPCTGDVVKIKDPKDRAISLRQLRQLSDFCQRLCKAGLLKYGSTEFDKHMKREGQLVKWTQCTQHEICDLILKKVIKEDNSCSWVEAITNGKEQRCDFFCSHNWAECFRDFMTSIEGICRDKRISGETHFWICVYANNQHNVELGSSLTESPFYRALEQSKATMLMLDKTAQAITRLWCVFEMNETLDKNKVLELWTPLGQVGSGLVSSGPIVQALNRIDTRRAKASNPRDQRKILNRIAGECEDRGLDQLARPGEEGADDGYEEDLKRRCSQRFRDLNRAVINRASKQLQTSGHLEVEAAASVPATLTRALTQAVPEPAASKLPVEARSAQVLEARLSRTCKRGNIADGEQRGITLQQLRDFNQQMMIDFQKCEEGLMIKGELRAYGEVDMYDLEKLYLQSVRRRCSCSYVETLAEAPQRPEYHVIYGSSITFQDFMAALEWHSEARQLPDSTTYFVVPFMTDDDKADRPEGERWTRLRVPSEMVLRNHAIGVVMLIDRKATVLQRSITSWEANLGIKMGLCFDLAAASGCLATTRPFASGDWEFGDFDPEVAAEGLAYDVARTKGRTPEDTARFLGEIAFSHKKERPSIDVFEAHNNFSRLNFMLREKVAGPVLRAAGFRGDVATIRRVVRSCERLRFSTDSLKGTLGETGVHTAAAAGQGDFIKVMLCLKANLNATDAMGETPLHYAALTGQTEVVRLLLRYKADPTIRSLDAETPLQVAQLNPAYFLGVDTSGVVEVLGEVRRKNREERLVELRAQLADGGMDPSALSGRSYSLMEVASACAHFAARREADDGGGRPVNVERVEQALVSGISKVDRAHRLMLDELKQAPAAGSGDDASESVSQRAGDSEGNWAATIKKALDDGGHAFSPSAAADLLVELSGLTSEEVHTLVSAAGAGTGADETFSLHRFVDWLYGSAAGQEPQHR